MLIAITVIHNWRVLSNRSVPNITHLKILFFSLVVPDRLTTLEADNRRQREEFNAQRARMKEFFLQKEAECKKLTNDIAQLNSELNEAKSQIAVNQFNRSECQAQDRRAQEEIASLQKLVHETIEESTYSKSEIERLLNVVEKFRTENMELRELIHSHQVCGGDGQAFQF